MLRGMSEVAIPELKKAVESQHGGTATFVQSVPIHEEHNGETVWDGTVAVFDLADHPTATRAYAWSYEREDGKRRFFAVLHVGVITGPREAVRAAIVAEQRPGCRNCGHLIGYHHLEGDKCSCKDCPCPGYVPPETDVKPRV